MLCALAPYYAWNNWRMPLSSISININRYYKLRTNADTSISIGASLYNQEKAFDCETCSLHTIGDVSALLVPFA